MGQRAIEIIHFATYTPTDSYYGLPEVTPALGAIVMELLARDFNIKFFDNNAIPQFAVIFEGYDGSVPEDTKQAIKNFFVASKSNPHGHVRTGQRHEHTRRRTNAQDGRRLEADDRSVPCLGRERHRVHADPARAFRTVVDDMCCGRCEFSCYLALPGAQPE